MTAERERELVEQIERNSRDLNEQSRAIADLGVRLHAALTRESPDLGLIRDLVYELRLATNLRSTYQDFLATARVGLAAITGRTDGLIGSAAIAADESDAESANAVARWTRDKETRDRLGEAY